MLAISTGPDLPTPPDTPSERASNERHERHFSVKISPVTPTPHIMRTDKTAGQEPFAAGSRMATHSTWCVIAKHVERKRVVVAAGQHPTADILGKKLACVTCAVCVTCGFLTHEAPSVPFKHLAPGSPSQIQSAHRTPAAVRVPVGGSRCPGRTIARSWIKARPRTRHPGPARYPLHPRERRRRHRYRPRH